jgi:hypothetical protein
MEEVLKFLGGAAIVLAAVGWLVRSLVSHFLSKDVESYKGRLQSQATIELERLRHSLRLIASEHEKQIHLLHERRAEVIGELYRRLIEFVSAATSFAALAELAGRANEGRESENPRRQSIRVSKLLQDQTHLLQRRCVRQS